MKTFKKLLSEVAEPQAGDEINFKKKHIIQRFYDPAGNDDAFTGNVSTEWDMVNGKRFYNHADYKDGEDEDVYESYGMLKQHHGAMAKQHNNLRINLPVGSKEREAHRKAALAHQKAFEAAGTPNEISLSSKADMATKMARRLSDIKESQQLDEISDKKLRTYMKAASDIAAKSDDAKTVAKRSDGVLKASEKLKEEVSDKSVAVVHTHKFGADTGKYGEFNVTKVNPGTLFVYDHNEKREIAFNRKSGSGTGNDNHLFLKKINEAHSHPLYDMHGLEDEDINNDGVVDEKDAAMKRARELLQKKRYYLEDVADDTTHIKNHGTKKKYAKTNAVLAPTHKVKSIVEEEQLDELSKKTLSSYVKKAADKLAEDGAAYAIGMSKAKKIHNDEPPLRKKTIKTAHKIAKAIIGESDESCNCYHIAGSEDSHHIENLKSLAPNSKIADGIAKVSRTNEEAIAYMDEHFPSLHEDIDQLDEISNEMKAKYLDKAVQQRYDFFTGGRNTPTQKRRKPASHYEQPEIKKALAKDAKRGEIIDKTAKALTGTPHYSKMSTSTSPAVHGNADSWWKGKKYSTESVELDEAMKLDSVNIVHHDDASADFAKKYVKAHKGDHRPGGPTAADERAQDQFYTDHGYKHIRHGFGGSGETHYKDGKTGHIYSVRRVANGKGFHGTDHHITKLNEDVDQLDELSKDTLGKYAKKALNYGDNAARMSHSDDDEMGKIASKRLTGVKRAVDRLATKKSDATRIKGNVDKARESARNRYTDKSDQGKAYYAAQKGIAKIREDVNHLDEHAVGTRVKIKGTNSSMDGNKGKIVWKNDAGTHAEVEISKGNSYSFPVKHLVKEDVDQLHEAFSAGSLKLDDGSYVTVNKQDAALLNQMFKDLNTANKKKMEKVLMTDKHGFQEILGFAREAL